ncbi:Mitochondrial matrix cochaperone [Bachmanniomyces sp. S44760]|nr:Mitochondrial matrix cochaperone [Bachmanniomyces sp. S44760]
MIQRSLLRQCRIISRSSIRPPTNILQLPRSPYHATRIRAIPFFRPPPSTSRCYSTQPNGTDDVKSEVETSTVEESKNDSEANPAQKELEAKNKEIVDLKDKYLRSVAEFRNLQERTKREVQSARDFAITKFAKDLIDSVDNLDRALSTVPESKLVPSSSSSMSSSSSSDAAANANADADAIEAAHDKDLVNLYQGLKMTERLLMQTLSKHGLERFDPAEKGDMFDPNLHEATFQTRVEGKEDGTTFLTQQKGFLLNGRVVRAAKVGVVKNT